MTGAVGILIKLGVRLVVFTAVFWIAARRNPKVVITKKWGTPLIALVFAILNIALYWILKPVFNLASLGALGFVMPLVINGLLLYGTVRIFGHARLAALGRAGKTAEPGAKATPTKPLFAIDGLFAMMSLALFLTVAHGICWLALDYVPTR
ncbi:MAG: phage holin family protein [Deltaproteobacteria bacterium]|nr:phage holin family protein [Deltaproteobacteria bacterium]